MLDATSANEDCAEAPAARSRAGKNLEIMVEGEVGVSDTMVGGLAARSIEELIVLQFEMGISRFCNLSFQWKRGSARPRKHIGIMSPIVSPSTWSLVPRQAHLRGCRYAVVDAGLGVVS